MTQDSSSVRFRKGEESWDVPASISILDRLVEAAPRWGFVVEEVPKSEFMEEQMDATVTKALSDMQERVREIMKADPEIRAEETAIARVAAAPIGTSDWAIWQNYKTAGTAFGTLSEPPSRAEDGAYTELERKAEELRKRDPSLTEAGAFAEAYRRHPELAAAQREEHLARTLTPVTVAPPQPFLNAYQILEQERAEHIRKAIAAAANRRR